MLLQSRKLSLGELKSHSGLQKGERSKPIGEINGLNLFGESAKNVMSLRILLKLVVKFANECAMRGQRTSPLLLCEVCTGVGDVLWVEFSTFRFCLPIFTSAGHEWLVHALESEHNIYQLWNINLLPRSKTSVIKAGVYLFSVIRTRIVIPV